jgi:hypothetical protein
MSERTGFERERLTDLMCHCSRRAAVGSAFGASGMNKKQVSASS